MKRKIPFIFLLLSAILLLGACSMDKDDDDTVIAQNIKTTAKEEPKKDILLPIKCRFYLSKTQETSKTNLGGMLKCYANEIIVLDSAPVIINDVHTENYDDTIFQDFPLGDITKWIDITCNEMGDFFIKAKGQAPSFSDVESIYKIHVESNTVNVYVYTFTVYEQLKSEIL